MGTTTGIKLTPTLGAEVVIQSRGWLLFLVTVDRAACVNLGRELSYALLLSVVGY
jgi:hypothetical protein